MGADYVGRRRTVFATYFPDILAEEVLQKTVTPACSLQPVRHSARATTSGNLHAAVLAHQPPRVPAACLARRRISARASPRTCASTSMSTSASARPRAPSAISRRLHEPGALSIEQGARPWTRSCARSAAVTPRARAGACVLCARDDGRRRAQLRRRWQAGVLPGRTCHGADAGNNLSKLQRSLSTVLALRRYFDPGERNDVHMRHDVFELRFYAQRRRTR